MLFTVQQPTGLAPECPARSVKFVTWEVAQVTTRQHTRTELMRQSLDVLTEYLSALLDIFCAHDFHASARARNEDAQVRLRVRCTVSVLYVKRGASERRHEEHERSCNGKH